MVKYPSAAKIIEFNLLVLHAIKVKKADSAKLLSKTKLEDTIEKCKDYKGDIYDKAVVLLQEIVRKHAFASGNRRTAFLTMKYFLITNNAKTRISDDPKNAKVMQGIREHYYTHKEIKEWIKNGKIKKFKK